MTEEARPREGQKLTLFTIGGVIAGALITGVATYLASAAQADAEAEQFLRSQKLNAYSQFIADSQDLQRAYSDFEALALGRGDRFTKEEIATAKKPVDDAYRKVNQDASVIGLIGSPEPAKLAKTIFSLDTRDYSTAESFVWEILNRTEGDSKRIGLGVFPTDKRRTELRDEFEAEARKDLERG